MSKIYADTIETASANVDITFGASGDAVLIPSGATLKTNKIADAGGNNLFTSNGSGTLTVPSAFGGAFKLLNTNTFTGTTSSTFTSGIDSTYDAYCFRYNAISPAAQAHFEFQCSTDGGSNYNTTVTSTYWYVSHGSSGGTSGPSYDTSSSQAQATTYQSLARNVEEVHPACCTGELWLYGPSSTTYAKHCLATTANWANPLDTVESFMGCYFNTTSAIDAISFKMSTGNMDGEIKMYGVSKS